MATESLRSRWAFRFAVAFVAAAGLALGACDGDNLFEGGGPIVVGGNDAGKPAIEVRSPGAGETVPLRDSVLVSVRVRDDVGVRKVTFGGIARRGNPDLGTGQNVERFTQKVVELGPGVRDTIIQRYLQPTADTTSESVVVFVQAQDSVGNITIDSLTVIIGGPRVTILSPPNGQALQAGRSLGIQIRAIDPQARIAQVELTYSGVASGRIVWSFSPARDSVVTDTTIAIPAGVTGQLILAASAVNGRGVKSKADSARYSVQPTAPSDTVAPTVGLTMNSGSRLEVTDSIRVNVTARDNVGGGGVQRVGVTVLAVNSARTGDTLSLRFDTTFAQPRTGSVTQTLAFTASRLNLDTLSLPDTLQLQVFATAYDAAGKCGASVTTAEQRLPCVSRNGADIASGVFGAQSSVVVVRGRTILLPQGGRVADAIADTIGQRLFLSNMTGRGGHIDVLNLQTMRFRGSPLLVGSQPWGLFIDRDSLIVANSGGTNLSFVHLRGDNLVEDLGRRLGTPNAVLLTVQIKPNQAGQGVSYEVTEHDFSDRPQFVARDSRGNILYSTVPTSAANQGTIRVVDTDPNPLAGDTAESKILFAPTLALTPKEDNVAIAHIDSIGLRIENDSSGNAATVVYAYDHVSGFPGRIVFGRGANIEEALANLAATGLSDVLSYPGAAWNIPGLALADTTFVAASGDRSKIAFGEGAVAPFAQIFIWDAERRALSNSIQIVDLVNNAAERVTGIGLNRNGSLGVARGQQRAYFFTPDLRLQGQYPVESGGAGAALHPDHNGVKDTPPAGMAFVGTASRTIQLIRTDHFVAVGEVHVRANVVGPLKASPPLPSDNNGQGRSCVGSDCVVLKLYGVTADGGVVVVDVRGRDIGQ